MSDAFASPGAYALMAGLLVIDIALAWRVAREVAWRNVSQANTRSYEMH